MATVCQQLHVVISYYHRLWMVTFDHAWENGHTQYTRTLRTPRIMHNIIKYYIYASILEGWCHCRLKSSAYCCKFLQNNIKLLSQCIQCNIAYCKRALYPIIILIIPTAALYLPCFYYTGTRVGLMKTHGRRSPFVAYYAMMAITF